MNEMRHAQVQNKNVEALVEDVMEEEELKIKAEEDTEDDLEPEISAPTFYQEQQSYNIDLITTPELQKSAEEILAGVKRPTAVVGNECLETFSFIANQDWYDREM